MNKSKIDYLAQAHTIGRVGYSHNIITGCKHGCEYCYARKLTETRLKDSLSYPYGFEPTFHPERVVKIPGPPRGTSKLIFCNDMGDVGGDWDWKVFGNSTTGTPDQIAHMMVVFANLNPDHIILLLTKRPEWYRFPDWPENVWCGATATNNEELHKRLGVLPSWRGCWMSLEPWLDEEPPQSIYFDEKVWLVIGGMSKPDKPVSDATVTWLLDPTIKAKRFMKSNAGIAPQFIEHNLHEYPEAWRVK